ncbi:MAG: S8 family serine peptidase [Candidatus Doudnabacteria bacterium]|nr:S8 family serine peptidase [Candidatus Doudnabacteria bacterium]
MKVIISLVMIVSLLGGGLPVAADSGTAVFANVKIRAGEQARLALYASGSERLYDEVYRVQIARENLEILRTESWVEFAEEDGVVRAAVVPADPWFTSDATVINKQWYLPRMQVPQAWEKTLGGPIVVAIVDTGIDARHQDLNDGRVIQGFSSYCEFSINESESGCVTRIKGEIAAGINSDDNGHGTIVAGLIGAISNNNLGITGINWNVKLMPIKALDASGTGFASDVAAGMRWATDNGARIINLSLGGPGLSGVEVLQEAVSYAFARGVLVIAAAGNDAAATGGNLNENPVVPVCADGGQNMIIGVAALDERDQKAAFSNYGSNCIDIAAPGTSTPFTINGQQKKGILSTYFEPAQPDKQNLYAYVSGTSVAAPLVTGIATLVLSSFPDLDVRAIRERIIASVDNIDTANSTACGEASCTGHIGGRINALKALDPNRGPFFASGTLLRDASGKYYLFEKGVRRLITDFVLAQRFPGLQAAAAETGSLDAIPLGEPVPPIDGTLLKDPASPLVYLVEGGERHPISYLAFVSRSLRFPDVITLSGVELGTYQLGADAAVIDGVLMKTADSPAVFIYQQGGRQLLSYFVFIQRGLRDRPIAVIPFDQLSAISVAAQGFLYPPVDGTLLRGDADPTVYIIQNGVRQAMNLPAFQNRGYSFQSVNVLPQSEVSTYQIGTPIVE